MKTILIILFVLFASVVILFFILGMVSRSGKAPGLVAGSLAKCPDKPNCVSSESKAGSRHFVEPITAPKNLPLDALPVLKTVIKEMGGIVLAEAEDYAAFSFSSAIFGFVDDLEIRFDANKSVLHIRSASRVGYSDRGVNRNRVEALKKRYYELVKATGK